MDYRRAIALNPSPAMAHMGLAHFLCVPGRPSEGMAEATGARALDAVSVSRGLPGERRSGRCSIT